jgi:hypothetical protein
VTALGKANVAVVYSTDAKRTVGTVTLAPLEYDDLFVVVPKEGAAALVRVK